MNAVPSQEPRFSVFKNCKRLVPCGSMTLQDLHRFTKEGRWRTQIEKCRSVLNAEGEDAYKEARATLPAVTLSVSLKTRAENATPEQRNAVHTGYIQLDFDSDDNPEISVEDMRALVELHPTVIFCAISPSGTGVKAVARCPASFDLHLGSWLAAREEYWENYGMVLDEKVKSPFHLSFVTDDPDAYFNPDAVEIVPIEVPVEAVIESEDVDESEDEEEDTRTILKRLKSKNRLVPLLMKGAWGGHRFPSQSEADFSLACSICEETGNHAQQEELFSESGLYRDDRKMRLAFKAVRKTVAHQKAEKLSEFDIVDEEEADAPAFPLHCLPPVAEKMAREMARVTTAQNEPLAAAAILGTLSASIGAGLELPTGGGRTVRGNLFLLAVADSGTGKGENFTHAAAPLFQAEAEAIQEWETMEKPGIASELAVAEKRAKRFCDAAAKAGDEMTAGEAMIEFKNSTARAVELTRKLESGPCYRVADATKEALAVAMQWQPGEAVASMSSEARGIFSIVKGRYGKEGGDEDFYCSGYSGDTLTVDRIGRQRVTLRRPCLSILWMVQPDAARKALAGPSLMESGMIPRFLMFDPKAEPKERFEHPSPIAEAIQAAWKERIEGLLHTYRNEGNEPATVKASIAAIAALDKFERENVRRRQRAGDLADVAAFVSPWTENAWRLALVLHAARHGTKAHAESLETATARDSIEIVRWFAARQLEMLHSGRRETRMKDLLALLAVLAAANGKITFRELRRSHSLEDEEIMELHTFFPHAFNIARCETGGRPSWVVTAAHSHSKIVKEGLGDGE